jgi:hypothetical protein
VNADAALALVRRTRRRLEGLRLLQAAARGALMLTGGSILLVLLGKATGGVVPAAFALPAVGLLAGLGVALAQPRIRPVDAALLLDARLRTEERFTTLVSNPSSPCAPRWAAEIAADPRALALRWPRDAGLVPVALFLLFTATLIPARGAAEPGLPLAAQPAESAPSEPSPGEPDAAAKRLAGSDALGPAQQREVERAIEAAFARPEERAAARAELVKAAGGDATARERLGAALLEGAGALGEPGTSRTGTTSADEARPDARLASPYPEEYEYLRAYRIEKARLLREDR